MLSNLVAMRDLSRLREENQRLRNELGQLTIQDTSKLHVIAVPEIEDWKWRWRLHLPPRAFQVLLITLTKPGDDEPTRRYPVLLGSEGLNTGERMLELAVFRGPRGNWQLKVNHDGLLASWEFSEDAAQTYRLGPSYADEPWQGGVDRTVAAEPGNHVVLLESHEESRWLYGGASDMRATGLRAWIEQLDKSEYNQLIHAE